MNKTLYFGNWIVFIWLDHSWFWKWNLPSTANDENYKSHYFYLGYLNFDVTWVKPEQKEA